MKSHLSHFNSVCITVSIDTWVRNIWGVFLFSFPQNERKIHNYVKKSHNSHFEGTRREKNPKYFAPKYLLTQSYKLNWNVTNVISHSNHHFICINILNKFMESHQFCQKQINVFCAQPLLQGFALFHSWPHPLEKRFLNSGNTISCTITDLSPLSAKK